MALLFTVISHMIFLWCQQPIRSTFDLFSFVMRLLPAVISPFSFVFFLYHRTKPPQRSVLFINLLGTRLTPRASMGDDAPSDGLLRSGVRRNSNVRPSTAPAHLGNTNSRPDSEIQFVVLTSLPFHQTFGHWWPFLPESFHYISRSNGSQHSPADRFLPLSEPLLFFKSAFCFRFFYVGAVKQKLACSEEIFTKESLFSVTLTAKVRTHC